MKVLAFASNYSLEGLGSRRTVLVDSGHKNTDHGNKGPFLELTVVARTART